MAHHRLVDRRRRARSRSDRRPARRQLDHRRQADEQPRVGASTRCSRARVSPDPRTTVTDIVVVRSDRYTVDRRSSRASCDDLRRQQHDVLAQAPTYLTDASPSLVSRDRHATMALLDIEDDDEAESVVEAVERADSYAAFAVSVTGEKTLDHDFNLLLSQEDLESGELQFGLPAALIILLLVFGAVVAGLIPLLMAIVSIIVALGFVSPACPAVRARSS